MEFLRSQFLTGFALGLFVWFVTLGANYAWRAFRSLING